jgi:hypothetical protein
LRARARAVAALLLLVGAAGCGKKPAPPAAAAGAPAAQGAQQAPPPGSQKAPAPQPGPQKAAAPLTQKAAPPAAAPARPDAPGQQAAARADSAGPDSFHIDYRREVYNYQGGPRDPFTSLLTTNEAQISMNDLRLVSILYDARGGRSVAIVRDRNTPRPFRVRRGDTLGRLRVIQIRQYEVVFQIEEFGFERQEVLTLPRVEVH